MITACVVILPGMEETLDCMLQSLRIKSKKITKVLVAVRTQDVVSKHQKCGHIDVEYFSFWFDRGPTPGGNIHKRGTGYSHAVGLHECLNKVTSEFVMLTEPDIVFYKDGFDELYLQAIEEHNLAIVGVTRAADPRGHEFFLQQAIGGFPTAINCLMRTNSLPGEGYLKGLLKMRPHAAAVNHNEESYERLDGKWLLQSLIPNFQHRFPKPDGLYPVGCNLYLWYMGKRWLSFHQEPWSYSHNHPPLCNSITQNLNNFNLASDFYGEEPLLYHSGNSGSDKLKSCLQYVKNNNKVEIIPVTYLDHTLPDIEFKKNWPHRSPYVISEVVKDIIKDKVVCDVGCAEGDQLAIFSKYAKRVVGTEINKSRGQYAVERGFDVRWGHYEVTGLPAAHVYFSWIGPIEDALLLKFILDNNIKCTVLNFCRKGNHLAETLKPYNSKILEFSYHESLVELGWPQEGQAWLGVTEF
jgi:hypothetical protein